MENKVAQRTSINELQSTLVLLLRFLGSKLRHDSVKLRQVEEDGELKVVARGLDLHGSLRSKWHLPLYVFDLHLGTVVVEVGLHIYHELVREHDKASLVEEVGISLDNEGMELVAIIALEVAFFLELLLPKDWKHPLNQIKH